VRGDSRLTKVALWVIAAVALILVVSMTAVAALSM